MPSTICAAPEGGTAPAAGGDGLPAELIAGRYARGTAISESATSTVFRATDVDSERDVVVKCFEPTHHGAFLREMAVGFDVEHPKVMRCLDAFHQGTDEGCIVYEYLPHGTLRDWLTTRGIASNTAVVSILESLLDALEYLHEKARIHCDIKPENIFVRDPDSEQPQVVLGDLGAACFLAEAQAGRHTTGTPAYLAPERHYNTFFYNSDLYSLGIMSFELATGDRPFHGTPRELARAHLRERAVFDAIEDPAVAEFIEGLLEKDPVNRVASARTARRILDNVHGRSTGGLHVTSATLTPRPEDSQRPVEFLAELLRQAPHSTPLDRAPADLGCFRIGRRSLLAAGFEEHVEIYAPPKPAPLRALPNAGSIQATGLGLCLYAMSPRIIAMNALTGERLPLLGDCDGVRTFSARGQRLVWHGERGGCYHDLVRRIRTPFASRGYVMQALGCVLAKRAFARSEGVYNSDVLVCDEDGSERCRWQLSGPVVLMTAVADETLLVMTIDTGDVQACTVWRLAVGETPARHTVGANLAHWCATPGHVFWMNTDGALNATDETLAPRRVGVLPSHSTQLAVSPDHRLLAACVPADAADAGAEIRSWAVAA